MTPLELAADVARRLDRIGIPYVIGGSLASALVGEPRSTADVDIAVEMSAAMTEPLVEDVSADFYVPESAVAAAVAARSSFNLVDRQWRDILGVLRTQAGRLDDDYLERTARQAGLADLLERARRDARLP